MRSSDSASSTSSASSSSRFWVPSQREYRNRAGMGFVQPYTPSGPSAGPSTRPAGVRRPGGAGPSERSLNLVAGFDAQHLDARADQLLKLGRRARQRGEGAEMHGHDRL